MWERSAGRRDRNVDEMKVLLWFVWGSKQRSRTVDLRPKRSPGLNWLLQTIGFPQLSVEVDLDLDLDLN